MSEWTEAFEQRVIDIFRSGEFDTPSEHHFEGHSFVSAYQLAVAFQLHHREVCVRYGKVIGEGKGMENLPAYMARQLSQSIKNAQEAGESYAVEAVWLSGVGLSALLYRHADALQQGSPNTTYNGFSMFRLRTLST